MSKRDLLRTLGFICVGVAFLIASGADVNLGSRSECVGILSFPHWLDEECRVALVPRLMFVAIGAVPAIVLFYFANKEREKQARGHVVKRPFFHSNEEPYTCTGCSFTTTDARYAGAHEGSFVRQGLRAGQQAAQSAARIARTSAGPPSQSGNSWGRTVSTPGEQTNNTYGFESEGHASASIPMPASRLVAAQPENGHPAPAARRAEATQKTCPDCAEEVRAAARKCRFCDYIFEEANTPS